MYLSLNYIWDTRLKNDEKASGSKINYEKTKGLFIGRLRGNDPD
jgi:hypothetical protein